MPRRVGTPLYAPTHRSPAHALTRRRNSPCRVASTAVPAYAIGGSWTLGFTDFAAIPVAGTYTLSVQISTGFEGGGNPTSGTLTAGAALGTISPLPTFAKPTFTAVGAGRGNVAVTVSRRHHRSVCFRGRYHGRDGHRLAFRGRNRVPCIMQFERRPRARKRSYFRPISVPTPERRAIARSAAAIQSPRKLLVFRHEYVSPV